MCCHGRFGNHAFGKTPEPVLATDTITGAEACHLIAAGNHYTGGVRSWNVGKSRPHLITAADHQIVRVADRGGMNVNQNFIRLRTRLFCLTDGQRLYPVECIAKYA
jgi:hypothetical protein